MKDVVNAKRYYYYSCDECADETLELYVQTLDDRCSVVNSKTRYFFDLENLRKLKKAMLEFGEEKLEVALVRAFYIFTHVEDWFDEESFESFCSKNCIYHRKTKVASGSPDRF
jgi:hypothetical protein